MKRDVVTAKPTLSLREAAKVMTDLGIGSLVIVEDEELMGIVTGTDILKAISAGKDVNTTLVRDIMSKPVKTVDPSCDIEDAVEIMTKHKIKRLVVVENDKIVGIVTASDILSIEPKLIEHLSKLISIRLPGYSGG
ncbi:MAG: CBS domain-containing protein [Candidatus Aenigmarchaeota archaeon]|nr:CBS domain-containing protein [Candidatus Aenigmarchaeota archaeon]